MAWKDLIPESEIKVKVTDKTVNFAKRFGSHLGTDGLRQETDRNGNAKKIKEAKLTTSQLRKFFGEVKKQQMNGYDETEFVLLKPKLAYAVGRAKDPDAKINDFYYVISKAIDWVKADSKEESEKRFHNFIRVFEAIVAYHKAAEESKLDDNNDDNN